MISDAKVILTILEQYLVDHPDIRFGQALVNIGIIQVEPAGKDECDSPEVQDPYYDTDKAILNRIKLPDESF